MVFELKDEEGEEKTTQQKNIGGWTARVLVKQAKLLVLMISLEPFAYSKPAGRKTQ